MITTSTLILVKTYPKKPNLFQADLIWCDNTFNSNPDGYTKRTLPGSIKFIMTSIFKEREFRE
jgi:hypothetical protein